ncbi:MAG: RHS repeat-associated core domain-containing protein [Gemmatimonadota bacterium]|nr:RHS repeat-associated core domain-containing protein [Gemmatimonadota bacterium]
MAGAEGSWTYDAVGNRTGAGIAVDLGNLLAAADPFTFVYDQAGRTIEKRRTGFVQTFHWNAIGQLDSVVTNGAVTRMRYDGFGRRVRREGPSGTEQYVWDGDDLHLILDGTGAVKAKLTCYPGIDAPHSLQIGFERYHYALDHAGNVIGLFDDDGNVAGRYRYDPWGRPQGAALDSVYNPLRFQAREWDEETGLYYVRARYYDPDTGRFLSPDPIGLEGGINPYVFAGNDPVHLRDPSGMMKVYLYECDYYYLTAEAGGISVTERVPVNCSWSSFGYDDDVSPSGGPSGAGAPPGPGPGVRSPSGDVSPEDGPSCERAVLSFGVSLLGDAAGVSLGKSIRILGAANQYARETGFLYRLRAQGLGSEGAWRMSLAVSQDYATAAQRGFRNFAFLQLAKFAASNPSPDFRSPWIQKTWDVSRMLPVLGTGIRLGEAIDACL